MFWFWIFVGPAVFLGVLALRGERTRAEYVAARMTALLESEAHPLPPVTLIVPVDGDTQGLAAALGSLAAQDHPDFELIVVVRNGDSVPSSALPHAVKVALAGDGSAISLRQAGVRSARRRSEVFAFAEATGVVSTFWLRALVAPLADTGVGASTGFRWYVPDPPSFWSLMRSVWNGLIADKLDNFAWAGAMATTKDVFMEARVNESWGGAVREDFALVRAVQSSGKSIAYAPGAMVADSHRPSAREFFRQARREMALAHRHLPRLFWTGLATHVIYCGAMLAAIVAITRGSRGAEWALVVQFGLGMLKGVNRATLAQAQLPEHKTWFDRYSWTHTFWTPAATWIWLYVLISSLFRVGHAGSLPSRG